MSTIVMCICHVGRLEQHHNSKHAAHYVATKNQTNYVDNRKIFNFKKRGIGIKREKCASKLNIKKVWKQVKDRAQ